MRLSISHQGYGPKQSQHSCVSNSGRESRCSTEFRYPLLLWMTGESTQLKGVISDLKIPSLTETAVVDENEQEHRLGNDAVSPAGLDLARNGKPLFLGLDLTKEPVVVSVPDTGGRYYLLPMLDMWSDVFASAGWRTTGTEAGNFVVAPPGWRPDLRDRLIEEFKLPKNTQRIDAPTLYVWIIGRTKTDGPSDYAAVNTIQSGFKITLLSQWGKTPEPVEVKIDPASSFGVRRL
jgi:Protein of unknown function (DUF1254)